MNGRKFTIKTARAMAHRERIIYHFKGNGKVITIENKALLIKKKQLGVMWQTVVNTSSSKLMRYLVFHQRVIPLSKNK